MFSPLFLKPDAIQYHGWSASCRFPIMSPNDLLLEYKILEICHLLKKKFPHTSPPPIFCKLVAGTSFKPVVFILICLGSGTPAWSEPAELSHSWLAGQIPPAAGALELWPSRSFPITDFRSWLCEQQSWWLWWTIGLPRPWPLPIQQNR